MDPQATLLIAVEAFLDRERMPATTFGIDALHDSKFVFRLRAGANMTVKTMRKAQEFMDTYHQRPERAKKSAMCAA